MNDLVRRIARSRLLFPLVCLVLVLLLSVVVRAAKGQPLGSFFVIEMSPANTLQGPLMEILYWVPELLILTMGMTVVASCSAGADISVGSVMILSGAVGVRVLGWTTDWNATHYHVLEYGVPLLVALLVYVVVGSICGVWNGFLVAKLHVQPMVATLILFIGARAGAKVIGMGQILTVDQENFRWAGNYITDGAGNVICPVPTGIFIAIAVVIVTALVLRFTALGTNIQAVGINARASRIVGLKSSRIIWMAFVFCGVCAGIAGIIATSRMNSVDSAQTAKLIELDAILAVALGGNSLAGGKFSLAGSVIGALTIQSLKTVLMSMGISVDQMPLYQAIVVVVIVVLQSPELRPMLQRWLSRLRGPVAVKVAGVKP